MAGAPGGVGLRNGYRIQNEDSHDYAHAQRFSGIAAGHGGDSLIAQERRTGRPKIKITDLRCAIIGRNPVVRVVTDQGVSGYGQAESYKPYLKPMVLFYKDYLLGEDPTDVERVMLKIRRLGAFKPWGSAVSAIEIALWDIAGQVAGVPVYKLLGGKIRDRVRIYNGGFRPPDERSDAAGLRRKRAEDEGSQRRLHAHQDGRRLPQSRDDGRHPRHVVRRAEQGSVAPEPRSA